MHKCGLVFLCLNLPTILGKFSVSEMFPERCRKSFEDDSLIAYSSKFKKQILAAEASLQACTITVTLRLKKCGLKCV